MPHTGWTRRLVVATCLALAMAVAAIRTAVAAPHEIVASSTNFDARSFAGGPNAVAVARHCEQVCAKLREQVFALDNDVRWQPKCKVVLHGSRGDYLRAVGKNAAQTVGSSVISISSGRVTQRRIDLLVEDSKQGLSALPHELVHVLFVDVFPTTAPPKWVEEGLALSMDTPDKRARHGRDLDAALRTRTTLPLKRLLADVEYPAATQRAAFYAQSLSLVEYLSGQASPREFLEFARLSTTHGSEHALAEVYQLDADQLERNWLRYMTHESLAANP